ncbi:MAG: hypothetical protein ABIL76_07975 [candidate division WOR-3 bacterium]
MAQKKIKTIKFKPYLPSIRVSNKTFNVSPAKISFKIKIPRRRSGLKIKAPSISITSTKIKLRG